MTWLTLAMAAIMAEYRRLIGRGYETVAVGHDCVCKIQIQQQRNVSIGPEKKSSATHFASAFCSFTWLFSVVSKYGEKAAAVILKLGFISIFTSAAGVV